jgi:fucose permease
MENTKKSSWTKLIPVMFCFFAMGFVDLVGIASNYVKADLNLTDSQANIFPSLVFFWFLIFSVPTGMLMNRIGRKKTVLISLLVTFLSLLLPIFGDGYALMLLSFSLLGIGNALMQTSLNPLLSNIVSGEKLASSLTFGQFIKAITVFGVGMACPFPYLHDYFHYSYFLIECDCYCRRTRRGRTFYIYAMFEPFG